MKTACTAKPLCRKATPHLPVSWMSWSACFWMLHAVRKRSRRRSSTRFARRLRHREFCSKFAWLAGSSRNGKRLPRLRPSTTALERAKGTKHDPSERSVQNEHRVDCSGGVIAVTGTHVGGTARHSQFIRRQFPPRQPGCSGQRTGAARSRARGSRQGAGKTRSGKGSTRPREGKALSAGRALGGRSIGTRSSTHHINGINI